MKIDRTHVNGWAQQSLLPAEHIRIEFTVHAHCSSPDAQVGVSITDSHSGETLGLSTWVTSLADGGDSIGRQIQDALKLALEEHLGPF